ncbi:MAG: H-X9-DG-CTERM domain-containing protein [Pirellulaceae bacterium]
MVLAVYHSSTANFLLGDGSVRRISHSIDMNVFQAAATRGGDEAVSLEP